ncbi:MAG: ribosomal protein S18-alanine N-acetyltransferase [Clostridiales bacterium]|nr:ribosomal protein S18-alanine N-acetyltransferase [Clostridiales bacterium]
MIDFSVRKWNEEDINGVFEIEKECFSSPWSYADLKNNFYLDSSHFYVALSRGEIIGYIGVQEICFEAYITNIAVKKLYRKHGVGEKLLSAAVSGAKERGCDFITLEVRPSNCAAIYLYEKYGFTHRGKRKNFYSNPDEDALIYTLNFVQKGLPDENSCH